MSATPTVAALPVAPAQAIPATTTAAGELPTHFARQPYAVYDKPADRRLRPWMIAGSIFLTLLGTCLIVFTFINSGFSTNGTIGSLWGLLAAGIIFCILGIFGIITGATLRPSLATAFFFALLIGWVAALTVMIVNGALLQRYMNNYCGVNDTNNDIVNGANRASLRCQKYRQYHIIVYAATGIPVALWVPIFIIAAGHFMRTTRLMRKEPYGATGNNVGAAPQATLGNAAL
eukprot:TRINITY_DN4552_c0_g1_i1.p1 TRINITY_DN4552_c0_g1~~TRINITY_DN4552_c0_g1_i1.p1  ORF type:complete len:232 (+),score=44.00 TRINITY_DN4552_c0_g1_i1:72-767(+)